MDFYSCQRKLSTELNAIRVTHTRPESSLALDGFNIDEGLAAPDNETFLLASMAFLQQHAKRKLKEEANKLTPIQPESKKIKSTYSNMLLFEGPDQGSGRKERYFIKLHNFEKFDNVLKSETSIPVASALSEDQFLPRVKKSQKFRHFFRTNMTNTLLRKPSLFNIFKGRQCCTKSMVMISKDKLTSHKHLDDGSSTRGAEDKNVDVFPEKWNSKVNWTYQLKRKCSRLSDKDGNMKYLEELNKQSNLFIKAAINEKLRARDASNESLSTVEKFLREEGHHEQTSLEDSGIKNAELCLRDKTQSFDRGECLHSRKDFQKPMVSSIDEISGINIKCSTKCTNSVNIRFRKVEGDRRTKLSKPLSKISVCLEDESDSEYDCNLFKSKFSFSHNEKDVKDNRNEEYANKESHKCNHNVSKIMQQSSRENAQITAFQHFADELKANFSPEVMQNIIAQMIMCLETVPSPNTGE